MKSLALAVSLLFSLGAASAQVLQSASVNQLVDQLAAPANAPATRGLRNLSVQARSVDLLIQFDFDSAKLQDVSKPLLDNLVDAMNNDRLMALRFKVEGHTDGKGSATYNQQLSQRRAASVVSYMREHGVEMNRLISEGKGSSELLFPDKPEAMENRRVRIVTTP